MCGLREDQELVEGIYTEAGDQFQTNGQTYTTEVVHRFVEREASRVTQRAIRPPELVFDNITGITQQDTPRFLLPPDPVPPHANQLTQQVLFRTPRVCLVRDLKKVPPPPRPSAVQASIRQAHLLKPRQHSPDLLRQHQPRQ